MNIFSLEGKNAWVTGASYGIGFNIACAFAKAGIKNIILDNILPNEVYIKSKEVISDFLSLVGAESALKKFAAFLDRRDESNRDNRARNCISGNADKTAIAAVKQIVAIRKIEEKTGFAELSEDLRALAKARLQYPTMSLKELAETLQTSKSCLNHRMRRLMEISEEL